VEPDSCESGCKCADGQLLQDDECVPISECDCYWDPINFAGADRPVDEFGQPRIRFDDGESFEYECNTCSCEEGMFTCTEKDCSVDCIITEYLPSPCSEECGTGVVIGVADVIVAAENGGAACPPLEKVLDECFAGDCVCGENEVYSNNTGCEYWCIALDAEPLTTEDCVDMEPGCRCEHGFFRDENGDCVPMEDCGCITRPNGEVKDVGEQWLSPTDECMICECLMGSNIPTCQPVCQDIPEVSEMEELVYEEGSCCPTVKPRPESTCQMKERLAAMNDSEGCVSDVAVRQTWCQGSCGESKDTPVLSMNADGTYSANSCKCCSGIPGDVREISLRCEGGEQRTVFYQEFVGCSCDRCTAEP